MRPFCFSRRDATLTKSDNFPESFCFEQKEHLIKEKLGHLDLVMCFPESVSCLLSRAATKPKHSEEQ
jgi:hypothetical protein